MLRYTAIAVLLIHIAKSKVTFEIVNREPGPIYVGIQGNPGNPHLEKGGFAMKQWETVLVEAPNNWTGRIWPRTWCDPASHNCKSGGCGKQIQCQGRGPDPPATLVEIALKDWKGLDYYGISLINGFNLRAFIEPVDGESTKGDYSCAKCQCMSHINHVCPKDLKVKYNENLIGCQSACDVFKTDQYCCRGHHDRPETCKSSDWPQDYAGFFKEQCPDAHSYTFDDRKKTFTCKASHYKIQFGAN